MSATPSAKHRKQRSPRPSRRTVPAAQPARRHRSAKRAGALAVTAVLGAAGLVAAPAVPVAAGLVETVHYDFVLTDLTGTTNPTPTFNESLQWLLDSLGIGYKTPAELFAGAGTMGDLLGASNITLSLGITPLLQDLGLQNITIGDVMTALHLPPTMTVDQALAGMQMLDTKMDFVLTPLGIPSTQTLLGVEQHFSIANMTVDQLLPLLGFRGNESIGDAFSHLGQGDQGGWFATALSLVCGLGVFTTGSTLDSVIPCVKAPQYGGGTYTVTGSSKLGDVLQHAYMKDSNGNLTSNTLANYTVGQAMNFNSSTTFRQFIDNLMVNLNTSNSAPGYGDNGPNPPTLQPLGSVTLAQLLNWAQMPATQDLATFISNLQVNSQPLGSFTLQDALDSLIVNPAALSTQHVVDTTSIEDFLNAIGFGTYTIDQLLNLTP